MNDEKCVIVIDENLPLGIMVNTAAILGISLGQLRKDIVGLDVFDSNGNKHPGIIEFPVPVLKGNQMILKDLMLKLVTPHFHDLTYVDFSDLAQGCKTYDEYILKMKNCLEKDLNYIGIIICGNKKKVNKLTGSLPLLR